MNKTLTFGLLSSILALPPFMATASAQSPLLRRAPYLQSVLGDSATVCWLTAADSLGRVRLTADGGAERLESETLAGKDHRVRIGGLVPGATYRYEVLDGDALLAGPFRFRTAPPPGGEVVRAAVTADSGTATAAQRAVASVIAGMSPDIFIHAGDLNYVFDVQKTVFDVYRDILPVACFYPAQGNHGDPGLDWPALFALPLPDAGQEGFWYSFDWGSAHFVFLDTEVPVEVGSPQRDWAEADLATARGRGMPWLILVFHRPPYTVGAYSVATDADGTIEMHHAIPPLADRYGVDLVLNGHDHNYQASYPIRVDAVRDAWQAPRFVSPRGTVYVITGGGGGVLYYRNEDADGSFNRVFASEYHAVELTVAPERLGLRAISHDGTILDAFSIEKGTRPFLFIRGDADGSGGVGLNDPVLLLDSLFLGQSLDCPSRCRLDGSASPPDITDAIGLLGFLFQGGPPPAAPFPTCGTDPAIDGGPCREAACP